MSVAHSKKETAYLKSVSEIIAYEVTNSNISDTTVTSVKLSNDGSHLNIYVVFYKNKKRSMEYLKKTKGFIKKRLAQGSQRRKIPELHFLDDDSQEKGSRIDELLAEIKKNALNPEK